MTNPDALRWNQRYASAADSWLLQPPNDLLRVFQHLLSFEGYALDAAAGVAANGLYLAERGLHVIALDISEHALRLARRRAQAQGVKIDAAVYDLSRPWLPEEFFDVIVNFRFLERALFPTYRAALKTGGLLFFEAFSKPCPQPPVARPEHYLEEGELLAEFGDWDIIHAKTILRSGRDSSRDRVVQQLVVRKPA